jgi:hypothetical protein
MSEFDNPIILSSPHERTGRVRDAQYTLNGHNFFKVDWLKGDVDGDWGATSAAGADAARWALGYPADRCQTGVFGQQLYNFLRTDGNRSKLPSTYLARRKIRLRQSNSVTAKAQEIDATQIDVTEYPPGSNLQKFGAWYGANGTFWCAEFVTWCFVNAGDKTIFARGVRTAAALWPWWMAQAGRYGLRVTSQPEPGDIVCYQYNDGHIGIFEKWLDRPRGTFQTIEGNTSDGGSQDNGGAVMRRRRSLSWAPTHFVRYPS